MATGWSELPADILSLIMGWFPEYGDLLPLTKVCRHWQSVAMTKLNLPLLVLKCRNGTCHSYYDHCTKQLHKLNLVASHRECVGSSHEWLVIVSNNKQIYLENPFSGVAIQLVSSSRMPERNEFSLGRYYSEPTEPLMEYPCKVVLSKKSSPAIIWGNCIEMAILGKGSTLGMARPGNLHWTIVHRGEDEYFEDVLYHDGKFYVVDSWGAVFVCDVDSKPKWTKFFDFPHPYPGENINQHSHHYLVVSEEGKMFSVVKMVSGYIFTKDKFAVFEVDGSGEDIRLVEAESLGGRAFFLGRNPSICLSQLFQGEGNCIYYTNEYRYQDNYMGIYHYEDGSFEHHYLEAECNLLSHATWLTRRVS